MNNFIKDSYIKARDLLVEFSNNQENIDLTTEIAHLMSKSFRDGNKILICGNGGSACDAMHFAEEFTGKFRKERKPLPVMHLMDPSHITCVGNDYGFDEIFSRGVLAYGKPGDWLVSLSTSGNSENVYRAIKAAKKNGLKTLALLGKTGGRIAGMCDKEFVTPGVTSDRIQEIHMLILHVLIEGIERELFPENY